MIWDALIGIVIMAFGFASGRGLSWWLGRSPWPPPHADPKSMACVCGNCGARRGGHHGHAEKCPVGWTDDHISFFKPMTPEQRLKWEGLT